MMDKTKIYDVLLDIFAEVFMRDDIPLSAPLSAKDVAGWDSIKQVEIIMETEQRFGVRFVSQEVDNFRNVGDLVATVMRRVG
jgi:acyl carrier protein